jgi:SET domain-containing protein
MNVAITAIALADHPAHGQCGLFARRHLAPDTLILFYIGIIHGKEDMDPTSDYDLSLDRDLGVGVDASKAGNEARFINDYRGVTQKGPNAEFREVWVDCGKGRYERRMAVYVLSAGKSKKRAGGIKKGEEILVSYGKGFWSERQHNEDLLF